MDGAHDGPDAGRRGGGGNGRPGGSGRARRRRARATICRLSGRRRLCRYAGGAGLQTQSRRGSLCQGASRGARRGPNFAGYLRVVEWSCGISCQRWMVVNTRNGRIHDSPEPAFSLEYQLNSVLLVVNTVGRFTAADPPDGVPIAKYYVWRTDRLQLIDTRA